MDIQTRRDQGHRDQHDQHDIFKLIDEDIERTPPPHFDQFVRAVSLLILFNLVLTQTLIAIAIQ